MMANNQTQCDQSEKSNVPTWALYGTGAVALLGAAGLTYYATIAESASLARVKLTKADRAHYTELLRRTGTANPSSELDRVRNQFAKALADDAEEPVLSLGSAKITVETDEGHHYTFPGTFFDRNGDGKMDFGEFLVAYVIVSEFFRSEMRSRSDVQKVMFAAMDEDANGAIDKNELSHFMHTAMALGLVHGFKSTKEATQHYLSMFDANGDGMLEFSEFCLLEKKALDYSRLHRNRAELQRADHDLQLGLVHSRTGKAPFGSYNEKTLSTDLPLR